MLARLGRMMARITGAGGPAPDPVEMEWSDDDVVEWSDDDPMEW